VERKSGRCISPIETETNVATNLAIHGFFKGVYTNHDASNDGAGALLSQGQMAKD